jgi:hypothetical protein
VDLFVIKDDPRPRFERQIDARMTMDTELYGIDVIVYPPDELALSDTPYSGLVREVLDKGLVLYNRNER